MDGRTRLAANLHGAAECTRISGTLEAILILFAASTEKRIGDFVRRTPK